MDDFTQVNVAPLDRQLESLLTSIRERPMPGLDDARMRASRTRRRRPVQLAIFVVGLALLVGIPVVYEAGSSKAADRDTGGRSGDTTVSQKLDQIAQHLGAIYGDPDITSDRWLSIFQKNKVRSSSGLMFPGPKYLIEVTGSFSLEPDRDPNQNAGSPCATKIGFLDIFVNKQTFAVEDVAPHVAPTELMKLRSASEPVHTDRFAAPSGASTTTVGAASCARHTASENETRIEVRAFLALESEGAEGRFMVTFAVPAEANGGTPVTLTVAHQSAQVSNPGVSNYPTGSWMFDVDGGAAGSDRWVVQPGITNACERLADSSHWTCYHTTADITGNSWTASTAAFEPFTVLQDMQELVSNSEASQISLTSSAVAGVPARCLTVEGVTTSRSCITATGVLASFSTPRESPSSIVGVLEGRAVSIQSAIPASLWSNPAMAGPWDAADLSCKLVVGCDS